MNEIREELEKQYLNKKVRVTIDDPFSFTCAIGTVTHVDDAGQLHGTWGGLAAIPGIDKIEVGDEDWDYAILSDNVITKATLDERYDFWILIGKCLYVKKDNKGYSRIVTKKAHSLEDLCDAFFLVNKETKKVEQKPLEWLQTTEGKQILQDENIDFYGGILLPDDNCISFICGFNNFFGWFNKED